MALAPSLLSRLFTTTQPPPPPTPTPFTCEHPRQSGPPITLRAYAVDRGILDAKLAAAFIQSRIDNATQKFLLDAYHDGCDASKLRQHRQDFQKFLAAQRQGMGRTDASAAYLKVSLNLASTEQFKRVLAPAMASAAPPTTLLDIGAGRGEATAALAAAIGGIMPILLGSNPQHPV